MSAGSVNPNELKGQDFVKWLSDEALRQVVVNHEAKTSYITVDLPSQAAAEARVRSDYHGRYLFELLQNANDAIMAAREDPRWSRPGPYRVRIQLTSTALIVANDGVPFLEKDVDSIYRWGKSSKDPNKSIGHKGVGFKSVLDITESPQIFSQTVQFHFDRRACYERVREIVGKDVGLELPITRFVFPYTIEALTDDRELVQTLLIEDGFATVIRLPLKVDEDEVVKRIGQDILPVLLLFLNGLDRIEVWHRSQRSRVLRKKVVQPENGTSAQDVTLYEGRERVSRWLLFDAPKREIADRSIISSLGDDAWERVQKVGFAVAFPSDEQGHLQIRTQEPNPLYVYFPTEVNTGLGYRIHGDFYVRTRRTQIDSDLEYNEWLAGQIAGYISSSVVPELVRLFPGDSQVVQALVPYGEPAGFAINLVAAVMARLRECPFVPTADGGYAQPSRIMLTPEGAAVDIGAFQQFFPSGDLSRRNGRRQFPLQIIERDTRATDFLVRLGATRLTFEDVFKLFDGREIVSRPDDYPHLYGYLWKWREELPSYKRTQFSRVLQGSRCIVTDDGSWIEPHDRLYHAKLRQETPNMPRAIRANLVHPLAYDSDGRAGATYKLLDAFRPRTRDYDAPDIIRSAIMPLFEEDRFKRLSLQERTEVYRYLFAYWQSRRGSGDPDVERVKGSVLVPARLIMNRRQDVWLPANQVYLSKIWTGDARLERIYDGFQDVAFLYQVRGLEFEPEEQHEWARFWEWLGVARAPRFLVDEVQHDALYGRGWKSIRRGHPHAGTELWGKYVDQIRESHAHCPSHGRDYRRLRRSVALEGFAALIERQDGERLALFYQLLAENWSKLSQELPTAEVHCYRKRCPQHARSKEVPTFFDFLMRNTEWIPAHTNIDGTPQIRLYQPRRCWLLSPTENPAIRNLLPTPFSDPHKPGYDLFNRHIEIRSVDRATRDDLVEMLRHLPIDYPDPNVTVYSGRRSIPRAVSVLTRWVIERINNSLALLSEPLREQLHATVPLVALEGDVLRYVHPPESVFFADDRYHAARWRPHLPFAPMDDNWRDAARFLGLKFISEHVEEDCIPGTILERESGPLVHRLKTARPYMLALVNLQRGSATQDVARYLSNLEILVVDGLTVHRRLTTPPAKIIPDREARVYLEESVAKRVGSAGRGPRGATLYVRKGFEGHYDLLGGPIAEFIRIPALADAFVILLDRGGKSGRLMCLSARGLGEQDVEEMRAVLGNLGIADEPETEDDDSDLTDHLLRQLQQEQPPSEPPSSVKQPQPEGRDLKKNEAEPIQFPEFDLSGVAVNVVGSGDGILPPESGHRQGKGGGGGTKDWERDRRLRELYGERGEQLIKKLEISRLNALGVKVPERSIRWLREEGDLTADHDFESIDLIDGEWTDIVIEVKATPSTDFRFPMSREELACARKYGDRYRLVRVINVASASPQVFVFDNPFTLWEKGRAYIEPRDTYVVLPDPRKKDKGDETEGG